jgi:hypothetical protein
MIVRAGQRAQRNPPSVSNRRAEIPAASLIQAHREFLGRLKENFVGVGGSGIIS